MAGETVGPVEPVQPVHEVTSVDPKTGTEVTLETNVDLHPTMTVAEGVQVVAEAMRNQRPQS